VRRPFDSSSDLVTTIDPPLVFEHDEVVDAAAARRDEGATMEVRAAAPADVETVTTIWFEGWQDAHAALLPEALCRLRTRDSFAERLRSELDAVRVVVENGVPLGFSMIRGAELYQFYVAAPARGTGAAAALMRDVEATMAARQVETAWLACAVGNLRAARFYEKSGWRQTGVVAIDAETSDGPFPLQVWRYEKQLRRATAVRAATDRDRDAVWRILEPMIRAGETYPLPRDMSREQALAYWFAAAHEVLVAAGDDDLIVGTYYLRPNQQGGGSHVANCGYVTGSDSRSRGVGRMMCEDSLVRAKKRGFRAMQFNFVVSSNDTAVRLWRSCGFEIVGRLPEAFHHPALGYVDALVMVRSL
jgi:ribosomal protein S18 acetylase RimI-like enzyme